MNIQTIGVMINPQKPSVPQAMQAIRSACAAVSIRILPEPDHTEEGTRRMVESADAILVLGGDGTILHAVPHVAQNPVPILGINLGRLGFLSEVGQDEIEDAMGKLAAGDFTLEHRMLLEMSLSDGSFSALALNDVVVSRGGYTRLVAIDAYVSGLLAGQYVGDGVIVSSPTGSTGYSLSAGGPIIAPEMDCMILAPICPHSLQARPIVMDAQAQIRLEVDCQEAGGGIQLTVDGRKPCDLAPHTHVLVRKANVSLPFIRIHQNQFYDRLRSKLSDWSR